MEGEDPGRSFGFENKNEGKSMAEADLNVEIRESTKHPSAKQIRGQGRVPAVFYYHNEKPIPLTVDFMELDRLVHSETNILDVHFPDGKVRKSIFREVQKDPITDAIIHVDIMGIKLTEKVRLSIPLILSGTPVGVKEGGILEHLLREVEVEGLPLDIPEHVEIDVSGLQIGDVLKLEDIPTEKFRFVTEIHHAVANVVHPKVVKEEEPVEELEEGEVEGEEAEEAEAGEKEEEQEKERAE